jgi:hypothetical protein
MDHTFAVELQRRMRDADECLMGTSHTSLEDRLWNAAMVPH